MGLVQRGQRVGIALARAGDDGRESVVGGARGAGAIAVRGTTGVVGTGEAVADAAPVSPCVVK
jgi:hypothetical protein